MGKEGEKKIQSEEKEKEQKSSGEISLSKLFVFLLKTLLLSVICLFVVIVFFGHQSAHSSPLRPSDLPLVVSRHLLQGQFSSVYHHSHSWKVFVSLQGVTDHSEETLLFLHSLPGSSISFGPQQSYLAQQGIASLAIDLPGFGLSDKQLREGVNYSPAFYVEMVADLLATLHIDSVHLVAYGNACMLAAQLAEQRPHLINSVVLAGKCEPFPTVSPNPIRFWFENSPAMPQFLHQLLFGRHPHDDAAEVTAANRWLLMYKNGYEAWSNQIAHSEGGRAAGAGSFLEVCKEDKRRCNLEMQTLSGDALAEFLKQLPDDAKQNKKAKAKPRVLYQEPGKDKYGMDDGHGHSHDHAHAHDHAHH